jgi:VanZ family protein
MTEPSRYSKSVSGVRRIWLIIGWGLILLVIYLSLTPAPIQVPMEEGDKLGHVLAYATLMAWFANFYEMAGQRKMLAISLVAMGIALEFLQGWTGYRSFEVADMMAGAAGVAGGWIAAPPRTPNCLSCIEKLLRQ